MALELAYFTGGARERVLQAILAAGHRITAIYVNDPERWPKVAATIELARQREIPVTVVRKRADLDSICPDIQERICFSAGFNYLFPERFIAAAHYIVNVHGSLLPKYPGARTLAWAIEAGERESGVTVHLVDPGMDTGAIVLQRSFPLSRFETTRSLARKTAEFEPGVVVEALSLLATHGVQVAQPQTAAAKPNLPNRVPAHSELDPGKPLIELMDKIRAADPDHYPAYFYVEGHKVCVRLWRPGKPPEEADLL